MMKKTLTAFIATLGLISILPSCATTKQDPNVSTSPTTEKLPEPSPEKSVDPLAQYDQAKAQQFTDTAKLLAGMTVDSNSQFADIQKTNAWINHRNFLENSWSQLESQQLSKVRKWSDTELKAINATTTNVFYPFSGPDILYAYSLFPQAKEYVLVGLEPIGTVPDFSQLSEAQRNQKLLEARNSLYALLQFSFFRTNDMRVDLANQGVLPVLLVFLARTNNRILDVKFVGIDREGNIQKLEQDKGMVTGVKIDFVREGETIPRTLYYFSTDLSNEGLVKTPQFNEFVKKIDKPVTYLKAASYLMYNDSFSTIRNLILAQSSHLLQDDSGMPLNSFDQKQWNLTFYGTYTQPIALFSSRYQADLRKVYQTGKSIKPLNFGIGYQFGVNQSNLMLADRK